MREQICKPETLTAIQEMLRRVVTEGTGKKARSPFVAISGKSGTAQLASGRGGLPRLHGARTPPGILLRVLPL